MEKIMNHSQVEFAEQMDVAGNDVIISTAFNIKDQIPDIYGNSVRDVEIRSESGNSEESAEEDEDSRSSASSSSSESSSSSSNSEDENDEHIGRQMPDVFETAKIGNTEFQLPRGLCEDPSIFYEFFSVDTWKMLPEENQRQLKKFLPKFSNLKNPQEAKVEQEKTLDMFFKNELKCFGRTPLQEVQENLEEGNYRPDVIEYRESIEKSKRREHRFHNYERLSQLAKELFISREKLLRTAYQSSPDCVKSVQKTQQKKFSELHSDSKLYAIRARKRFHGELLKLSEKYKINAKELMSDEDELEVFIQDIKKNDSKKQTKSDENTNQKSGNNLNVEKKYIYNTLFKRKQGLEDEESLRVYYENTQSKLTNRSFRHCLLEHKRRKLSEPNHPDFETCDIRLRDVCSRSQLGVNFKKIMGSGKAAGRKPKATTVAPLSSEPPALVPILPSRKYEQVINNDEIKNTLLPNSSELPPLTKTLSPFSTSSFKNEPLFPNSNQILSTSTLHEDNEVFNILGGEVELPHDVVDTYSNNDETLPSFVLEKNPELPQNVLQAAVGNEEVPKKRSNKIDFSMIIDSQKLPKLEPISSRPKSSTGRPQQTQTPKSPQQLTLTKKANIANSNNNSKAYMTNAELIQETHACFFALVRDFFCTTQNHRMRFYDLKNKMDIWLKNPITALNEWFLKVDNWSPLLSSAVKFLTGDYSKLPNDYVPFIEHKEDLNIFQWIGAGRDSDARLTELCTYWLQLNKDGITAVFTESEELAFMQTELEETSNDTGVTPPPPPPRCPTSWTVRPATPTEIAEFHRQERERFENPHKAYTYKMHGYESVVGPVKGIYAHTSTSTKARGHSIMVADRPNFVTILTLVRDATARLPNGEGTRADISELLKCSQYINHDAAENVLQSVVSGALDRMHTEHDPCVRYDAKKKIWIYLHRNRTIEEFEKVHNQTKIDMKQKKAVVRKGKVKSTGGVLKDSSPVDAEDISPSIVTNNINNTAVTLLAPVNNFNIPALVPSNSVVINKPTMNNKPQPIQSQTQSILSTQSVQITSNLQHLQPLQPIQTGQSNQSNPSAVITKCPPVPPLKYNIPSPMQQKSLLKITRQAEVKPVVQINSISPPGGQQRTQMQTRIPVSGTNISTTTPSTPNQKQFSISLQSSKPPIVVATPKGLQTIRVTNTSSGPTTVISPASIDQSVLSATVGGKKVTLNKPIIINQITQHTSPKGRTTHTFKQTQHQQQQQIQSQQQQQLQQTQIQQQHQQNQQQQQQQPQTVINLPLESTSPNLKETKLRNVQTVYVDQSHIIQSTNANTSDGNVISSQQQLNQGKNIIRLIPALNNTTSPMKSIISTTSPNNGKQQVQIIGQRVVTTPTIRTTPQKTISNISIMSNSPSNSSVQNNQQLGTGGAIVKMTPQAFAALQQKQSGQQTILVKQNSGSGGQQQRIIVGNTAIIASSANSNNINNSNNTTNIIVSSPSSVSGIVNQVTNVTPTSATITKTATISTQNLTPQQQRIIQNLKQQPQQQNQHIQFKAVQVVSSNNTPNTYVHQQKQQNQQQQQQTQAKQQLTQPQQMQTQMTQLQPTTITRLGSSQSITLVPQRSIASSQAASQVNSTATIIQANQNVSSIGNSKPMTVVVSQSQSGVTRLIKAPVTTSTTNSNNNQQLQQHQTQQQQQMTMQQQNANILSTNTSTGQIISLESLIQKQGGTIRIAGSNTSIVKTSVSQPNSNQIIQISGNNLVPQNNSNQQFTVVSQPRNIITLSTTQRLITTQANNTNTTGGILTTASVANTQIKEMPKVSGTMATSRIVTSSSSATISPRVFGKTTMVAGGGNINLSQLQGKQVVFTTKTPATIKNLGNTATSQASQIQTSGVILGGQTVKIQGNTTNLQQGNKGSMIATSQANPQLQTVIMGNQILKVQQLSQISTSNQSRVLVTNPNVSPITTIANTSSSGTILVNSGDNVLNSNQNRSLPKTIVLGSPGQTIRLQPTSTSSTQIPSNIKTIFTTQQHSPQQQQNKQQKTIHSSDPLGGTPTSATIVSTKSTVPGNRVVFTVPGTNQIFLSSSNFQGAPLNIKQLQNMKLVSINTSTQQTVGATTNATVLKTESNSISKSTNNGNNNTNSGNAEIINISNSVS